MNEENTQNKKRKVLGPGRVLQLAREEKNLRPEDIAYEIRLTASQVTALEEDDYSKMPEETYVRGYLRNYARLVGVPENDIFMAFARFTRAEEAVSAPPSLPVATEPPPMSRNVLIAAAVGLLAVIVLSTIWVMEPAGDSPLAESTLATQENEEETDIEEVPVGTSTLKLDATPIPPESEQALAPEIVTINNAVPKKKVVLDLTPVKKNTNGETTAPDGGVLIISYSKDSWTDIRDANGAKLLYRTVKAGEKVALAGALPISLFFGFAQGVEVKFNGKVIDVSVHTRGVFARFTVGEAVNQ